MSFGHINAGTGITGEVVAVITFVWTVDMNGTITQVINAQYHQRAFDLALNKSDRPQPPKSNK